MQVENILKNRKVEKRNISAINNYLKVFIISFFVVVGIVSFGVCIFDGDTPKGYKFLWCLPLFTTVCNLLFLLYAMRKDVYNELPILIITALIFVRNVVSPMAMALESYNSMLGVPDLQTANLGIFSLIYEIICIYLGIITFNKLEEKSRHGIKIEKKRKAIKVKNNTIFKFIILAIVILCGASFIIVPELKSHYYTIFTSDMTHIQMTKIPDSGFRGVVATLGIMFLDIGRVVISAYVIYSLRLRGETLFNFIISLVVIGIQFFLMTETNLYVIILAVSLFMYVYRLFPKYSLKAMIIMAVIGLSFFILMYVNRFSQDHYGTSLSKFLQAYLPSVANFSNVEEMRGSFFDILKQSFIDLYATIPFRSTLFGYEGGLVDVTTSWNQVNGLSGQIMPTIAQSYYYFGTVLSPLLSLIMLFTALKSYNVAKTTDNAILSAVMFFIGVYTAIAVVGYNFYIFSKAFVNKFIFMIIIALFAKVSIKQIGQGKNEKR